MAKINITEALKQSMEHPQTAILLGMERMQRRLCFYRERQFLPPSLIMVHLTEDCNMRCPMCLVWKSRDKFGKRARHSFISKEDIKKVVDEVKRFKPVFYLTGGEPLLCKDIFEIISYIHDKGIITSLVTNGWLLPDKAEGLVNSGLDFICVSIDGPKEVHDQNRGVKGSFDRAVAGIEKLIELKKEKKGFLHVKIGAVIVPPIINDLDYIVTLAKELKVDEVSFQHFSFYYHEIEEMNDRYVKSMHTGSDIMGMKIDRTCLLSDEQINTLESFLIKNKKGIPFMPQRINSVKDYYKGKVPSNKSRCRSPFHNIIIRQSGDIELCQGYVIGNIKHDHILQAWNNERARRFRQIILRNGLTPACFRCCYLEYVFDRKPSSHPSYSSICEDVSGKDKHHDKR